MNVDNEFGLVLAGGGTKEAYQIGVWKALKELNIKNIAFDYAKQKGIENNPLREMIGKNIDMDKIYNSEIDFGLVAYSTKKI